MWTPTKLSEVIDSYVDRWNGVYWTVEGPGGQSTYLLSYGEAKAQAYERWPDLENDLD